MKKQLPQELIILQHQLMMALGLTLTPDEMLHTFSQQAIESLQLTAVYIDQKENPKADIKTRSLAYFPKYHTVSANPAITPYIGASSPKESEYLQVMQQHDKFWYCFSLKDSGYIALERPDKITNDELLPALTEVIKRMGKTYIGRKLFALTTKHQAQIQIISKNLRSEKIKLEQILSSIMDCVLVLDKSGLVNFTNLAASNLFGASANNMMHNHFTQYFRIHDLESKKDITRTIVDHCMEEGDWSNTRPVILKTWSGRELFVRLNVKTMFEEDPSDNPATGYFVSTFHDMTDSYELEQKLQWQATHDALTGCLNRHGFSEIIDGFLLSRKKQEQLSFISVDLDRFKLINDIAGHHAGDALLKHVVQLMERDLLERGSLARLGGDEFGIIFDKVPKITVEYIAENIRNSIDRLRFKWEENVFSIGASIGVAHINNDEADINDIFIRADEACLMSKENGRNQVTIAPTVITSSDKPEKTIHEFNRNYLHHINRALTGSDSDYELVLYQQDIRSISDSFLDNHHEILLRLLYKNTIIPPDTFLPAAERSGIVREIDLFVLAKTLRHLTKSPGGYYNVNLSGVSLSDDITRKKIFELISKHPQQAKYLCLEVTETAAITNLSKCINFMEELNDLGVNFALDDFGTGVSSFSYLKSLPVKYLKIDGTFIRDICSNEIDEIVVQSIVSASRAMKIRTVAEYVSDQAILSKVTSLGIDYAQGYWMSVPTRLN